MNLQFPKLSPGKCARALVWRIEELEAQKHAIDMQIRAEWDAARETGVSIKDVRAMLRKRRKGGGDMASDIARIRANRTPKEL